MRIIRSNEPLHRRLARQASLWGVVSLVVTGTAFADTTSSAGGGGGSPFTLSCPEGMVLVGIQGRSALYVDRVQGICARLDANSQQVGGRVTTGTAGGTGGSGFVRRCADGQAVVQVSGKSGGFVDRLFVQCAPIRSNGLRDGAPRTVSNAPVGTSPGGSPFTLTCPSSTIARGLTGRASAVVDRIALVCDPAPVVATSLASFIVDDADTTPGATVTGTVRLNGYTVAGTSVALSATGLPGVTLPASVAIPANGTSATFPISSTSAAVGCATVTASAFNTTRHNTMVFSPGASSTSLSLTLDDRRQEARYFLGETIAAQVTLPRLAAGKLFGKRITFTSSAPEAVAAPASVFVRSGTTSVPISVTVAGQSCVVLTATAGGQTATTVFRTEPLPG